MNELETLQGEVLQRKTVFWSSELKFLTVLHTNKVTNSTLNLNLLAVELIYGLK